MDQANGAATGEDFRAPALEVLDTATLRFVNPAKKINEGRDVAAFLQSKAYSDLITFLLLLNRAMFPSQKQALPEDGNIETWEIGTTNIVFSEPVRHLQDLLQELNSIVVEAPPDAGPRRFGNIAFRRWYSIVEERSSDLLQRHLPTTLPPEAAVELSSYLLGSFGSAQRLDYGSGHELSFLAFLGSIWKLGGFPRASTGEKLASGNQERGIVLGVIHPYLQLIRRLIQTYTLEPAGSHGVWGLDDHSFLPYIFGSAQYGPPITPSDQTPTEGSLSSAPDPGDVVKHTAVQRERGTNLYFGAIGFIYDVKKGPFWEHSPMLYDISAVRGGWGKINKGMIKMYNAEVLSKFPVVQHFRFGTLFSWDRDLDAPLPPASVYASNQPAREDMARSSMTNRSTTRSNPSSSIDDKTQAPWASVGTAVPPTMIGTAAPLGTGAESCMRPTRFSQPQTKLSDPMDANTRDGAGDAQRMPPPTKAPWAKPP
ncbi:MAG: hypothetical protein Q9217_002538 [Psora testacea]